MLPLLLLTTLLLPLTQGETCLSRQDVFDIVKKMETKMEAELDAKMEAKIETMKTEMETKMEAELETKLSKKDAEIQTKLDKKDAEIEIMKAEMEQKVESAALPGAVAEAVRDLPQLLVSVYQSSWSTADATITFDSYISDYNTGGGDGTLDLATGVFTCLTPGQYTITYSGQSVLNPGERNIIYLYVNGAQIWESRYIDYTDSGLGGWITTQGSRSLILHLGLGHTLELRTDTLTGTIWHLILNISLMAADSLESRTTNTTSTHSAP